jgi:hypothetical protein
MGFRTRRIEPSLRVSAISAHVAPQSLLQANRFSVSHFLNASLGSSSILWIRDFTRSLNSRSESPVGRFRRDRLAEDQIDNSGTDQR